MYHFRESCGGRLLPSKCRGSRAMMWPCLFLQVSETVCASFSSCVVISKICTHDIYVVLVGVVEVRSIIASEFYHVLLQE
jgi:hypothetical protein